MTGKSPFSKVDQIGVVVRDMDKAIEHYRSLGIGPFEPLKNVTSIERTVWGKPIALDSLKMQVRVARMGSVDLELIQPVEGDAPWTRFLKNTGEGINHLGFYVDDIWGETAKLEKQGYRVLYTSKFKGGGGAAYFDTGKVGGVLFELIQWPPQ